MTDKAITELPRILLQPKSWKRFGEGAPWAFSNEIQMDNAARKLRAGTLVRLCHPGGETLALAHFNPHSLIAARAITRTPEDLTSALSAPDWEAQWLQQRVTTALALRERLFASPYYRLIHAEADGIPGLVIDRYGDVISLQANTAAMDRLLPVLDKLLGELLSPATIIHRNDSLSREREGLSQNVSISVGAVDGPIPVQENDCRFLIDPLGGQKTGWFYDHRDNRAFAARLAATLPSSAKALDLYGYAGAFALPMAKAGAQKSIHVTSIDRSAPAQTLATQAAEENGLGNLVTFEQGDVFSELENMALSGRQFDLVIADPPAFAKNRKSVNQAAKAYAKLTRLAANVVAPQGILMVASCSQLVSETLFLDQCRKGLHQAGRTGRILRRAGAGPDHPLHPGLPESGYLKALFFALD